MKRCPSCKGAGEVGVFVCGSRCECRTIVCDVCGGVGEVTEEKARWILDGRRAIEARRAMGLTTREAATKLGLGLAEFCDMQFGRADPAPLLKAFRIEPTREEPLP